MKIGSAITIGLIAVCGVLGLLAVLYASGWSRDVGPLDPANPRPVKIDDLDDGSVFDLGDVDDYREIGERPLFAADRQPDPGGGQPPPPPPPPTVELDVAIGGIIINGDTKNSLVNR